jgi:hypothetical protein
VASPIGFDSSTFHNLHQYLITLNTFPFLFALPNFLTQAPGTTATGTSITHLQYTSCALPTTLHPSSNP